MRSTKRRGGPGKRIAAIMLALLCLLPIVANQAANAASSVSVTIPVKQTFSKNPATATASDTFTYSLTRANAAFPLPASAVGNLYSFTVSGASGTVNVGPIVYTAAGVYEYELKTNMAAATGYIYDTKVYTVRVYVANAGDDLSTKVVILQKNSTEKAESAAFAHTYGAKATDQALMTDPPVEKLVSGDTPSKDSTFTFKLTAKNASQPMPSGSSNGTKTITITGSGKKEFGTWSYTAEGTYYYTVSEVKGSESGYTYDTAVYTITDNVKAVDGQLVLTRVVTNSAGKPVDNCLFVNKYKATSSDGSSSGSSSSGGSTGSGGTSGPKTGDDANPDLYRAMIGIGGIVFLFCALFLITSRRRGPSAARMAGA